MDLFLYANEFGRCFIFGSNRKCLRAKHPCPVHIRVYMHSMGSKPVTEILGKTDSLILSRKPHWYVSSDTYTPPREASTSENNFLSIVWFAVIGANEPRPKHGASIILTNGDEC